MNKIFFTLLIAVSFNYAYGIEDITYKNTNFGISENEFTNKFKSDNFRCETDAKRPLIRICRSSTASYAELAAQETSAYFFNGKLSSIYINFTSTSETTDTSNARKKYLVDMLQKKYGKHTKLERKKKNPTKELSIDIEETTWTNNNAQELVVSFMSTSDVSTLMISIRSLKEKQLVNDYYQKHKLSDM